MYTPQVLYRFSKPSYTQFLLCPAFTGRQLISDASVRWYVELTTPWEKRQKCKQCIPVQHRVIWYTKYRSLRNTCGNALDSWRKNLQTLDSVEELIVITE